MRAVARDSQWGMTLGRGRERRGRHHRCATAGFVATTARRRNASQGQSCNGTSKTHSPNEQRPRGTLSALWRDGCMLLETLALDSHRVQPCRTSTCEVLWADRLGRQAGCCLATGPRRHCASTSGRSVCSSRAREILGRSEFFFFSRSLLGCCAPPPTLYLLTDCMYRQSRGGCGRAGQRAMEPRDRTSLATLCFAAGSQSRVLRTAQQ